MSAESFPEPTTNPESLERSWLQGETRKAAEFIIEERSDALVREFQKRPLDTPDESAQEMQKAIAATKAVLEAVKGEKPVSLGDVLPTIKLEAERRADLVRQEMASYEAFFSKNVDDFKEAGDPDPVTRAQEKLDQLERSRDRLLTNLETDREQAQSLEKVIEDQLRTKVVNPDHLY